MFFILMTYAGLVFSAWGNPSIGSEFPPPDGYSQVKGTEFSAWVLDREVEEAGVPVRTYDGRRVSHAARVVRLPLVPGDRQQCADSLIRLRAEWQREAGVSPMFHATSGDPMPWDKFRAGQKPVERDGRIRWVEGSSRRWEDYLARVFIWAGTASLEAYDTVVSKEPRPGDILVDGGFPGHAVLLLDVAVRGEETLVLVGEGFMPAQNFHVELGPRKGWWVWKDGVRLPHWGFSSKHLRRFR
jgi:hypothetical protein